jgi:hypothetical protein
VDELGTPILTEYHNTRLALELVKLCQQPDIVELVFKALIDLGDCFAIDALYYADRDKPELRNSLLSDLN